MLGITVLRLAPCSILCNLSIFTLSLSHNCLLKRKYVYVDLLKFLYLRSKYTNFDEFVQNTQILMSVCSFSVLLFVMQVQLTTSSKFSDHLKCATVTTKQFIQIPRAFFLWGSLTSYYCYASCMRRPLST